MPGLPAAFIDRDGVINEDRAYVSRANDFVLLPGAIHGLMVLQGAGFALVVVTNQSGIARGLFSEIDYQALTNHMRAQLQGQGVTLAGVYHCPHHPTTGDVALRMECDCRKPRPGLLLRARTELGLDLAKSVLVGDKRSDIEAGRAARLAASVLVRSGHALTADDIATADAIFPGLSEAAHWLVRRSAHGTHP